MNRSSRGTIHGKGIVGEGIGYLAGSAIALAADLGSYYLLSWWIGGWYCAAAGGFLVGSVVAYVISVRWVFARRVVSSASAELAIFVLIGCFGLLVVQGVMWVCIEWFGLPGGIARLVAVGFSFTSNFALRKLILFRSRGRERAIGEVA
ncbi:GtrA family protein [Stenotrophomonas geniculata]|uniref:GtrA family protein n=1 Tax=Stenotrophomonas geniculata TaxID=86188 RepID=UPI0039B0820A